MKHTYHSGFIALISAIIISAILLVVIIGGSLTSYYSRFNVIDAELKQHSSALADACVEMLLIKLADDAGYAGGVISVGPDTCTIKAPINPAANPRTYPIQAAYKHSYTNILVSVDVNTLVLASWQEITNL